MNSRLHFHPYQKNVLPQTILKSPTLPVLQAKKQKESWPDLQSQEVVIAKLQPDLGMLSSTHKTYCVCDKVAHSEEVKIQAIFESISRLTNVLQSAI